MTARDAEHLRLLSIFQFVYAGLMGLVGMLPLIYVLLGLTLLTRPGIWGASGAPPRGVGWLLLILGGVFTLIALTLCALNFTSAICLRKRRHRVLCLVIACVDCLNVPLGALLGLFILIVLLKETVKPHFDVPSSPLPYGAS